MVRLRVLYGFKKATSCVEQLVLGLFTYAVYMQLTLPVALIHNGPRGARLMFAHCVLYTYVFILYLALVHLK